MILVGFSLLVVVGLVVFMVGFDLSVGASLCGLLLICLLAVVLVVRAFLLCGYLVGRVWLLARLGLFG